MFWWSSKKKVNELEKKTQDGFSSVKKDIETIGSWIKHLDNQNKQLFNFITTFSNDLSSLNEELCLLKDGVESISNEEENKQLFNKLPKMSKQTAVYDVQNSVQTAVQTDNFHGILKRLTGNERLLVFTLLNSNMKLSYEDLSLLLGKERSTIRGQINSIKQKSEILIREISEKNGKKRVFVPEEIKGKMEKYAKVRTGKKGK
jgi:hypothetical protein